MCQRPAGWGGVAGRIGSRRLVVNGSFMTDVPEPNDVDCAILIGMDYPRDEAAAEELEGGLPFLQVEILGRADFDDLVERFYATDRLVIPKGMVEVTLWT